MRVKAADLLGKTYNRLTIEALCGSNERGESLVRCRCQCGSLLVTVLARVRSGNTKSCGCLQREAAARSGRSNLKHGGIYTGTYSSWKSMKERCLNPNSTSYPNYGARGVKVCQRWADSFESFLSDMGHRPAGTSLDRFPNQDGDYEPANCRWATTKQQGRNTRSNRKLTVGGETRLLIEWSELTGISPTTILDRLRRGWSVGRAVNTPADISRLRRNSPQRFDALHNKECS